MRVGVKLFSYLRDTFGAKELAFELKSGSTVLDLLDILCNTTERRKEIYQNGQLKPQVVIFKNGANILNIGGLAVELEEGDNLNIFPFIGGG